MRKKIKAEMRLVLMFKSITGISLLFACFLAQAVSAGNTMVFGVPEPLPEFALIDQNGKPFTKLELEKQWSFMSFGYTSCPDACPTTLGVMETVFDLIKAESSNDDYPVKSILVSLDPVRDTPQHLKEYIQYFGDNFLGVTGIDNNDLNRLAYPIGVEYGFVDTKTNLPIEDISTLSKDREYLLSHFSGVFIIDPSARVAAIVFPPHEAEGFVKIFTFIRQSSVNNN